MHSPPRILIVDDNETNRDILLTRLSMHGYDLKQAVDGEDALAAAKEHLPDLILLDVMMPKLDGIEVCKRLRADEALPFMPIILCTGYSDLIDEKKAREIGIREFVMKPYVVANFVQTIRKALETEKI